ncbi:histone-fold-containing protein [Catenaria anguillulae PL171]|uniref:DNA polymerase epsilon subunit D n=1 Tax=Catenaria anguillulae PL171 TaxID=765915 RepID=A0A1Y2HS02_9FUNG|nr:histone-fold-containing protein [Catenaria anguillulae PL171]
MTASTAHHSEADASLSADAYPVDDLLLPLAQITRILRTLYVPDKMSLSREARIGMNQATITFVNFITALAQEIAAKAKKKTISANDVLSAIEAAGFQEFLPILREALEQLQKQKEDKRSSKQIAASSTTTAGASAARSSSSTATTARASSAAHDPEPAGEAQGESDTDLEEEIDIMDTT